jgi:hypothetical protein
MGNQLAGVKNVIGLLLFKYGYRTKDLLISRTFILEKNQMSI